MHTSQNQSAYASQRRIDTHQPEGALSVASRRLYRLALPQHNRPLAHPLPPASVHGREEEIGELADSFQRAAAGELVFFLLSGRAGIGKTVLVRTLREVVRDRGGRMLEGSFDRDRQHSPYTGLTEALSDLICQLCAEAKPLQDLWRTRLIDGLGTHCALLAEMAPALRQLIGPVAPAPELPWPASGQRIEQAFRRLVSLLATREHPLLLFIDDIHWADEASLHLLQTLMQGGSRASLMLVATCRDEELESSSPVARMLTALRRDSAMIVRRGLGPLSPLAIGSIISDVHGRLNQHEALARLLFRLSSGNPGQVRQLLREGETLGWLHLVRHPHGCDWHTGPTLAESITNPLMASPEQRFARLPSACREALEVAACLGRRFDPVLVGCVLGWTPTQVETALAPAALDELVTLSADDTPNRSGRFCSDEIQLTISRAMDPERAGSLRLAIGRASWRQFDPESLDEHIFDVVDQVNKGLNQVDNATMRVAIAALNLGAGLRASRIAAYRSASHYFGIGISLLPADTWQRHRSLSFSLLLGQAEALIALGDALALQPNLQTLSRNARTPIEHLRIRTLEATHHHHAARFDEALTCGLEGLVDAGIALPDACDGNAIAARFAAEHLQLGMVLAGQGLGEAFSMLPAGEDTFGERLETLISSIADAATMMNAPIIDLIAIIAANRCLERGHTRHTPMICSLLARALIARASGYGEARELALAAMRLASRIGTDPWAQARLLVHQFSFVLPWSRHIDNNLPQIEDALTMTARSQDPLHGAELQALSTITQFILGRRLDAVTTQHQRTASHGRTRLAGIIPSMTQPFAGAAAALRGETRSLTDIDCEELDSHAFACRFKNTPFMLALLASARLPLHVLAGEPERALEIFAAPELQQAPPFLTQAAVQFWRGLACARLARTADGVVTHQTHLDGLAEATDFLAEVECCDGGENVTHRLLCLLGEQTCLQGEQALAFEFLADAAEFADRNGYTLESGLIHERIAELLTDGHATSREIAGTLAKAADRYRECQAMLLYRRVRSRLFALPQEVLIETGRPSLPRDAYAATGAGASPSRLPSALAGARALIVDDESTGRKLLTQTLAGYLPAVETACSTREALLRIGEAVTADSPFTLIMVSSRLLQDIGTAFVRRVRRTHLEIMPPTFLLLTDATAMSTDAHLLVGFDAAVKTPVDTLVLFDTLRKIFSDDTAVNLRSQCRPRTLELAGLRVLLCESDPTHRSLALELLRRAGMYADTAADGHGAVEQLRRSGPDRYCAVLMAFDLPGVDGISATRMLRSDHRFDAVPIIAMNSEPIQKTRDLCLRAGMNDQLPRPLNADRLYDTLSLWTQPGALTRHEAANRTGIDPAPDHVTSTASAHTSPRAEIAQLRRPATDARPAISHDLQRMQGSASLYLKLLGRFRATWHASPDHVRAALARTDIPAPAPSDTSSLDPAQRTQRREDPVFHALSDAVRQFSRALGRLTPGARNLRR